MPKQYPTFSTSVPDKRYIDLVEEMARRNHRSRSKQIVYLIEQEARRLGLLPTKRIERGASQA
ncbi:MAG TPA: hypothetical protein G4N96_12010 [Chloroflexi bacterium]|nr:MAG: hypothetical protein B6243_00485 [Anaerolineaceae bacterium 4572_5.2]HEY85821.1 hypothetical protein [Chloroflexota bacterium]